MVYLDMKFLVVGLGNIGDEYLNTRHNIGFTVVEKLCSTCGGSFVSDRLAFRAECRFKGKILVLVKPTTFMNLSGKAVNYWLQAEKIPVEHLMVVTDDIALPFGAIRIKANGSSGGHNGLSSIQETMNTSSYARLRFGVGNDFPKGRQVEYVLGRWTEEEQKLMVPRIELASEAIKSFAAIGIDRCMNLFNNK